MKVEYVDHMGSDASVVNAARVSMAKQADQFTEEQNNSLIHYLARGMSAKEFKDKLSEGLSPEELWNQARNTHSHFTPFAHTAITLRVTAPIPIRVQCFKSKVGFVENEESRRYISSKSELFIPWFRTKGKSIKQGSGEEHPDSYAWRDLYRLQCEGAIKLYERMLKEGIAPEQARFVLPQGVMTTWIWTGSLMAYARFYTLRTSPHAQKEIQELASMISEVIRPLYPVSWEALTHG